MDAVTYTSLAMMALINATLLWRYLRLCATTRQLAERIALLQLELVGARATTRQLAEDIAPLQLELDGARAARDRYFVKIQEFEQERTQWQKLYTASSIGHGNAQNLMLNELDKVGRLLQSRGIKYEIPRVLKEVREEYVQTHEAPARDVEKNPVLGPSPWPPPAPIVTSFPGKDVRIE